MSTFDHIIGQDHAVQDLERAAHDAAQVGIDSDGAMTHAWLFTGPPGSGRSTLALAFAAALVCPRGGCGECVDCRNVAASTHPDVEHIIPEGVTYSIKDTTALIERAALLPARARWHVIVIEDVDRLTLDAAAVLLKSLEEPPPQTVWMLCAPTSDDVFETIRSRCRHVVLHSPALSDITDQLVSRYGIDRAMASFAARVAQGHIGRARALAIDEGVRIRRKEILDIAARLNTLSACYAQAARIVANAEADTDAIVAELDEQDEQAIRTAFGEGAQGTGLKSIERQKKSAIKDLEKRAKTRRRRVLSDQYHRVLLDLTGYYRDVLVIQSGSDVQLINEEMRVDIAKVASQGDTAETLMRIDAIHETRDNLMANVNALSAFESLLTTLRNPSLSRLGIA